MNINKFTIKEDHKFFKYVFSIQNEDGEDCASIVMKTVSMKIMPFELDGALYEVHKKNILSPKYDVFKNGLYVGRISQRSAFKHDFKIKSQNSEYHLKSKWSFKDISILEGNAEVGKVSRKTEWFKSRFGMALHEHIDPVLVSLALFIQLATMRAAMAA